MESVKKNEVIESVLFGIGIRLKVTIENSALVFRYVGYIWRVFKFDVSILGKWLMGNVYVEDGRLMILIFL